MSFFSDITNFLSNAVGNNRTNDTNDIRRTKQKLYQLGYFDEDKEEEEPNGYITAELDSSIRRFQDHNNLQIDGILLPGGETEETIARQLEDMEPAHVEAEGEKSGETEEADPGFTIDPEDEFLYIDEGFPEDKNAEGPTADTPEGAQEETPDPTLPEETESEAPDPNEPDPAEEEQEENRDPTKDQKPVDPISGQEDAPFNKDVIMAELRKRQLENEQSMEREGKIISHDDVVSEYFANRKQQSKPQNQPLQYDATGRIIRTWDQPETPLVPERKPEIISPTPKGNELLDLIGELESSDNYNVLFGGEEKPLTKMTIKEVYDLQQDMIAQGKGSSAVGRYQFLRATLKETVDKLGINENSLFDEKLQDKLARSRLEFRGFEKFKAGKISADDFIKQLANEWAALPKDPSNVSRHDGVLNNKALTDFKTLKDLLEKI